MFVVNFHKEFDTPEQFNLTSVSRLISLSGFDALNYVTNSEQTGLVSYSVPFLFKPQPFSVVLLVTGTTAADFRSKIDQIQSALRQYKKVKAFQRFVIRNTVTNKTYEAPALIERVSISQQTGSSAVVTISGVRRSQGVFVSPMFNRILVSASTTGLPKTVTFPYPHSFPSPLRIILYGPINAGFQIIRNEGLPLYDFTLTVGTNIPSGQNVTIDYTSRILDGDPPVYNERYIANPEILPDLVVRPAPVVNSNNNVFTFSGPSSSGSVTLEAYKMEWSLYD